tara:strand:- start:120 stop:551 length:432 start_codon:yes stop_codon:yes gene_type:complete
MKKMISKQHLAIGIINTVISNWEETYPMLCEHPNLKKDLIYIRDLLQDKYLRKLKIAECHMYHLLEGVTYEADLANDLEKIQKAIQDIGKDLVHRAAITSATLLDSFNEEELKERDLEIMQERVTALENYLDPYIPKEEKTNV